MSTPDEDRYVHGTYSHQEVIDIDGVGKLIRPGKSADFIIDTQTQQLVQVGDDSLDVSSVDAIATMLDLDPAIFWPHLREQNQQQEGTTP